MLRVGIAGLGFMGMIHYLNYQRVRGVKVVAIAEHDAKKRAGDWRSIQGNFGPPGEKMDLTGVSTYASYEEMLGDPEIDAVDLTLPPALHAKAAIASMKTGKAVFCEKPISLSPTDGKKMMAEADKTGLPLLIGHVLPFLPEYGWASKVIAGGKYGKAIGGTFKRVISEPLWLKNYWVADQVGGPLLDLHVHDAHFIRILFGMPTAIYTSGREKNGLPKYWNSQFEFASGATVHAVGGTIDQQARSFTHGFEIHLERATLTFEFAVMGNEAKYLCPPTLIDDKGAKQVKMPDGDPMMNAFAAEIKEVVRSIKSEKKSAILDGNLALDALTICHKQAQSLAKRKVVKL